MKVIHKLTVHMDDRHIQPYIDAVQGDANTRVLELKLFSGGEAWTVPAGMSVSVAYRKSDGTSGWYDTLPDGTAACSYSGNIITATLAPQVLTAPGLVQLTVIIRDPDTLNQLAAFPMTVAVAPNPAADTVLSNDYYNITTLAQVNEAIAGKESKHFKLTVTWAWDEGESKYIPSIDATYDEIVSAIYGERRCYCVVVDKTNPSLKQILDFSEITASGVRFSNFINGEETRVTVWKDGDATMVGVQEDIPYLSKTDPLLQNSGVAADAKAVGDALAGKANTRFRVFVTGSDGAYEMLDGEGGNALAFTDIQAAIVAGKECYCKYGEYVLPLTRISGTEAWFAASVYDKEIRVVIGSDNSVGVAVGDTSDTLIIDVPISVHDGNPGMSHALAAGTFEKIASAHSSGKLIVCRTSDDMVFHLDHTTGSDGAFIFSACLERILYELVINGDSAYYMYYEPIFRDLPLVDSLLLSDGAGGSDSLVEICASGDAEVTWDGNGNNVRHKQIADGIDDNDAVNVGQLNRGLAEKVTAPAAAEVGQTLVVTEVDENGKPTSWECADAAGSQWKKIRTVTVPEDVSTDMSDIEWRMSTLEDHTNEPYGFRFYTTDDGSEFAVRELYILATVADVNGNYFGVSDQYASGGGYGNLGFQRVSTTLTKRTMHIQTFGEHSLYTGYIATATSAVTGIFQSRFTRNDEDITSLLIGLFSNNALVAGSTFEVWGR